MWVKKPDMSTMTKSQLEDVIKKWHPKINGARIIAFALTLLSLGLGVKSCRNDKEIGEKNAKIATLEDNFKTLEANFDKLSEEHQTILGYAEEAAKVCGLIEENKLLNDSIGTLNYSINALNAANDELSKKLKKCQQSKKKANTVQKDTVYVQQPKVAEPENKLKLKVHIERKIDWVHVNSR